VLLTPAGTAFLDAARSTLAGLERGVAAAVNAARAVAGRLAVGSSVAAAGETRTRLLTAFAGAYPAVELELVTFDLSAPAAGLLDHRTDVALIRPPVDAPGIKLAVVEEEPRVFVLPAAHPLAGRDVLELADVAGLPWVAASLAADGCAPARWRDEWLVSPRPGGDVPVIGAEARTIDEWREHVVAGHGISLCPASSEEYNARPGHPRPPRPLLRAVRRRPRRRVLLTRQHDTGRRPQVRHKTRQEQTSHEGPQGQDRAGHGLYKRDRQGLGPGARRPGRPRAGDRPQQTASRRRGRRDRARRRHRRLTALDGAAAARDLAAWAAEAGDGHVDILVNNVGAAPAGPTESATEAEFDQAFTINVKVPFFLVAALAPAMAARGQGAIVSTSTMVASFGQPGMAIYGASRAALELLTKAWAAEYGPAASGSTRSPPDRPGPR
jgi:NAD(P)-dependent dehydrogenase (short-subunit alcohol dehydrogenase family)/DNA-binding transcriptional LysR family regulator